MKRNGWKKNQPGTRVLSLKMKMVSMKVSSIPIAIPSPDGPFAISSTAVFIGADFSSAIEKSEYIDAIVRRVTAVGGKTGWLRLKRQKDASIESKKAPKRKSSKPTKIPPPSTSRLNPTPASYNTRHTKLSNSGRIAPTCASFSCAAASTSKVVKEGGRINKRCKKRINAPC